MNFDSTAGTVAIGALVFAFIGLLVFAVARTRGAVLLGMHEDGPWWFSPVGGRAQGLVLAYVGGIVAVSATVYVVASPYAPGPVAWTFCWSSAAVLVWATVTRFGRYLVMVGTGGRATWDDPLDIDFVEPDDALDDVDLIAARSAAVRGDWQPAAHLLAATGEHDTRFHRVQILAEATRRRRRWLDEWLTARPEDPHALVLRAQADVIRAWSARGSDWAANDVDGFLGALEDAEDDARSAVDAAPMDPSPHVTRVIAARGLSLGKDELEERLTELRQLAPFQREGLEQALQYKSAKWFGSRDEMFTFAREVTATAPAGSAVSLLVLVAHVEEFVQLTSESTKAAEAYITSSATRAEIAAAEARWQNGTAGPSPVDKAYAHNLLAFTYWLTEDPARAAPHLAQTRQYLSSFPWSYADEPRVVHARAQAWLRQRLPAAAAHPEKV